MKKLLSVMTISLLTSGASYAGYFGGFTKGNKCAQYCYKVNNCQNVCVGNHVFGTTMTPIATYKDLVVIKVNEKGVDAKESTGKNRQGFLPFGTFLIRK